MNVGLCVLRVAVEILLSIWKVYLCLFWRKNQSKSCVRVNQHQGTRPEVGGGKDRGR